MAGVRVLDLSTFIAGPYAAGFLGEFGAEVIKVEEPGTGDPMRRFGTASERSDSTLAWLSEGRNKHSLTLNLRDQAGADILKKLAAKSQVLIEGFRPGTLERWGIGPKQLLKANPALVICRISGFGQTGPYATRPAFARIAHAVGGLAYLAGMPDGPPLTPGSASIGDYMGGMHAVMGILAALRVAESTGQGQVIDVSLTEAVFRAMEELAPAYAKTGFVRPREGLSTRNACPHGHYLCGDGKWVAIACTSDRIWDRFARNVLGRNDLADEYPAARARIEDREKIDAVVNEWTGKHALDEVVDTLVEASVPVGAVNSIADIFADPHFAARGAIETLEDDEAGEVSMPGTFPKLSLTPGRIAHAGPALGDWNKHVLGDLLGMDEDEIAALKDKGVI